MKKRLLLAGMMAFSLCGTMSAQMNLRAEGNKKWDGTLDYMINHKVAPNGAKGIKSVEPDSYVSVIVRATNSEAVAEALTEAGYKSKVITDATLTAAFPLNYIQTLAAMPEVISISSPRQHKPLMDKARAATNVDQVQLGTSLETPFTGKGVVIGVIDQGFEFKHAAFLDADGNTRVRALWDRSSYDPAYPFLNTDPTTDIPNGGDEVDAGGHATHVTNIAAGSKVGESPYYGVAPDAEIIMIPSTFADDEVIEDVKYIKDFAEAEGKPWVVNMSFGSHIGPHDGTTDYDQAISDLITKGGAVVAAMGNEGEDYLHASHTFTSETGTVYLVVDASDAPSGTVYLDLWGNATDGQSHLTVTPVVYKRGTVSYLTDAQWRRCGSITSSIDPNNGKENFTFYINTNTMSNQASSSGAGQASFALAVSGAEGDSFHAWVNAGYGSFSSVGSTRYTIVRGDNDYCVAEGGAGIPKAIAVGAYVSANQWTSASGRTYQSGYTIGDVAPFSNYGPWLGNDAKPTITAPGSLLTSAISQYDPSFDPTDYSVVSIVRSGNRNYYYGSMQGTSQATPMVTGIIALWLQANPALTYDDIISILKKTAIKDQYTTDAEWDKHSGYGKIDAYAGLVEALNIKNSDGIGEVLNSETPVTLSKGSDAWKVLFNNDETYADIAVYTMGGACVTRQHLDRVRRGNETKLDLEGLTPGAYLVKIETTSSNITRKVLVK